MKKTLLLLSMLAIGSISAVKRTIINNLKENLTVYHGSDTTFIESNTQVILEINEEYIILVDKDGFDFHISTKGKRIISIKKELSKH